MERLADEEMSGVGEEWCEKGREENGGDVNGG